VELIVNIVINEWGILVAGDKKFGGLTDWTWKNYRDTGA